MLVPTLSPGDIVIMDNLGSHKSPVGRNAIREAGGKLLFLPPYSPDWNPFEQAFTKLKTRLRKAADRTVLATWKHIGTLLTEFKLGECVNYLRNSEYASHSVKEILNMISQSRRAQMLTDYYHFCTSWRRDSNTVLCQYAMSLAKPTRRHRLTHGITKRRNSCLS